MTDQPTEPPSPGTGPVTASTFTGGASPSDVSPSAPPSPVAVSSPPLPQPAAALPQASGPPRSAGRPPAAPAGGTGPAEQCPVCGTENESGATFCEACGADVSPGGAGAAGSAASGQGAPGRPQDGQPARGGSAGAVATPQTAPAGEESPLDVGWTGVVATEAATANTAPSPDLTCLACGQGQIVDGYCDHCGTPPPDPRSHFTGAPATWVGGVCDIGKRHSRNEDAMCLSATDPVGSRAVLVVCDGVSMATDSHIASLAAAQAALAVLDHPFPRGVGTPDAWAAGAGRALTTAVTQANTAVAATVEGDVPNPPSCTFAAAVIENGVIVAANVGDSRVYWLPDDPAEPARQLGADDSFAQEQINAGVDRHEAEAGPQAHAITRWLGQDSPDDLTPHLTTVVATPGWLMVCSDGLWNYCSDAQGLRELVQASSSASQASQAGQSIEATQPGQAGTSGGSEGQAQQQQQAPDAPPDPAMIAQLLVDFANEQGGRDNITVALARLAGQGSNVGNDGPAAPATATPKEDETTHG